MKHVAPRYTENPTEDIVFEEMVTLNRPYLLCWASYSGFEKPEHQHEYPATAWEPAGEPHVSL